MAMFENDRYHYQFYQITEGKPDIQLCDNLLDINETENYDFYKKLLGAEFNDEFTYDKTHYKIANIWNLWDFKREIVDIKYDCSDIDDGDIIVVKHKNRIVFSQACRYDSYYYKTRYEDYINVQNGDQQTGDMCTIDMALDINGTPSLILAPNNYKLSKLSPGLTNMNANVLEGVVFSQFATVPYNIDGWTAQIIQHEVDHCNGVLI